MGLASTGVGNAVLDVFGDGSYDPSLALAVQALEVFLSPKPPTALLPVIAQTIGDEAATTTIQPTSGTLTLTGILVPAGAVISKISVVTAATAGATMTHQWFGLYDAALNLLAVTADATSGALAADTVISKAIATTAAGAATTYTDKTGGFRYVGVMIAASTVPTLAARTTLSTHGRGAQAPFLACTSDTGLTTVPGFPTQAATAPAAANVVAQFLAYLT